jgi:tight adherence protein C
MTIPSATVPLLISTMVFFAAILLFVGLHQIYRQRSTRRSMIDKVRGATLAEQAFVAETTPESSGSAWGSISGLLSSIGKRMMPTKPQDYSRVRQNLVCAGFRKANAPTIFWGTKCLLALLFPAVFLILGLPFLGSMTPNADVGITLFLAIAGLYVPDIWLRNRTEKRKDKIREGLPDALDLLVVCVEAGMGLDASIHRVAEELALTNKTLSGELKLYGLEQRAGKPRHDALKNLANRIDIDDVHNLSSLLTQTDRFGTSLAQSLRVYSDTFRTKRYMKAEEKAAKLPGKMLFPLILFIFPSLLVSLAGPAVLRILDTIAKTS